MNQSFPQVLGRYRLEGVLGAGGMGVVYRAYDETLQRHVALKVIQAESREVAIRFTQEARAQAKVEHEHICKIYEVGEAGGKHFIAMQLIEGKMLHEIVTEISLEQKVKIMMTIAEAVHEAHKRGLIHRDIKPSNILVETNEAGEWKPYIMDFGLAREVGAKGMTVTGILVGTPAYMAPEQAEGVTSKLDRRTDVYGLGATLYEVLTGRVPFEGDSAVTILMKLIKDDPKPVREIEPSIPRDLEAIALKSLEKEPQHRYESARAFAEDLGNWLAGESVLARRTDFAQWIVKKGKKHRVGVTIGAIILVLSTISAILMIRERNWAAQQVRLANAFGQEAEQIDAYVRRVYLLPRHNVTYMRTEVKRKMQQIQEQMDRMGDVARGPGNYALGRGYMALGDYRAAQTKLESSWNKDKYQTADVAYALGLTLVEIYRMELEDASRIPIQGQREARIRALDGMYRAPALGYIGKSKVEKGIEAEYVSALLQYLDHNYAGVTKSLEPLVQKTEWLYEVELLMGDANRMLGNQLRDQGQAAKAGAFYDQSQKMYEQAIRKGESDPRTYEHLCGLQSDIIWMHAFLLGEPPQGGYGKALSACDEALEVNPQSSDAWFQKVLTMNWWGEYQVKRGMDPRPITAQAAKGAIMLIRAEPKREMFYTVLGGAYWVQAEYEEGHGLDPTDSLHRCESTFTTAVSLNPNDAFSRTILGGAYAVEADYGIQRSLKSDLVLQKAMEALERSRQTDPQFIFTLINLGYAKILQGRYAIGHGTDPRKPLNGALQDLEEAWRVNPGNILTQYLRATAFLYQAEYATLRGLETESLLQKARDDFHAVLKIDPHYSSSNFRLGMVEYLTAAGEMDRGDNPEAALKLAEAHLEKAVQENPAHAESLLWQGKTYLLESKHASLQKKSTDNRLSMAKQSLNLAVEKNPRLAEGWAEVATYDRMIAERSRSQNNSKASEEAVRDGLRNAETALDLNPDLLSAKLERAALSIIGARCSSVKPADLESSRLFLSQAIQSSSFLQHEYGRYLP